ncbi:MULTISPECIES: cytochrome C assembly family protein [Prosthecochloris]|uniref:Cytochrome C biogenesis protein n=1 Tax=Prosthecochloris vibrioformis TaxID=1098 RepID=A0A5C4S1Y7_PROVB|nr:MULTISPECIES: cytochrome c biogenesis protein CcsA [Prosthecochloris]ANT64460.1 cytochrome c-type biogenesis protein CcsB [Prosthecochloris sp. CIB 2401]TNJ37305.1 cytochrome C biogenesis protein [Prosthecochloris vibrioformis]
MENAVINNTLLASLTLAVSTLYVITTGLYAADFFKGPDLAKTWKQPALILTIVAHIAFIGFLTAPYGYRLGYSSYTIMSMVSLTLAVIYMFIEFTTKTDKTGFFVLSFASGAEILSTIFISLASNEGPAFNGLGIGIHLFSAIFSFSAIAIAGLYSFLYLLLFRQIKKNSYGVLFENLPNLEVLERLTQHAVAFGFFFLTLSIAGGAAGLLMSNESINIFDPKLIGLFIIWMLYGTSIFIRKFLGWDTQHQAYLLIILFVFITLLVMLMSIYSPTFHSVGTEGILAPGRI